MIIDLFAAVIAIGFCLILIGPIILGIYIFSKM